MLQSKVFCLSGVFEGHTHPSIKKHILLHGGTCVETVKTADSIIVAADKGARGKLDKARERFPQIEVISLKRLYELTAGDVTASSTTEPTAVERKLPTLSPWTLFAPAPPPTSTTTTPTTAAAVTVEQELWANKYCPQREEDIIGNSEARKIIKDYLTIFKTLQANGAPSTLNPLLIHGPAGTGKTSTVRCLCRLLNYSMIEIDACVVDNAKKLEDIMVPLLRQVPVSALKNEEKDPVCIFVDDFDALIELGTTFMTPMMKIIRKYRFVPIICTCSEIDDSLRKQMARFRQLQWLPPSPVHDRRELARLFQIRLRKGEKVELAFDTIEELLSAFQGDVRAILNHLQFFSLAGNTRITKDQIHAVQDVFASTNVKEILPQLLAKASKGVVQLSNFSETFSDSGRLELLVYDNYVRFNPNSIENCADVMDYISSSDLINPMEHESDFESVRQLHHILSTVAPISITTAHNGNINTRVANVNPIPSLFNMLSSSGASWRTLKSIAHKSQLHINDLALWLSSELGNLPSEDRTALLGTIEGAPSMLEFMTSKRVQFSN